MHPLPICRHEVKSLFPLMRRRINCICCKAPRQSAMVHYTSMIPDHRCYIKVQGFTVLSDLFLIRHGQPIHNPAIRYDLPPGPDLSERGRAEARQAAAFLADKGIERLLVSPFARTTQTAEVLVDALGLPVTFTSLVQEHAPHESFEQVRNRVRELLASLNDSPYQRVAIVTHGSPIRALLLELSHDQIDLRQHVYHGGNPAPTCGIWHVAFNQQRACRWALVFKPS